MPVPYVVYAFVVGFGICLSILHAGFERTAFLPAILIGGAALAVFRVIKRKWLTAIDRPDLVNDPADSGWTASTFGILAAIYAAMILVAAFWYGIGFGLGFLIRLV